jgi:hypothetical protein
LDLDEPLALKLQYKQYALAVKSSNLLAIAKMYGAGEALQLVLIDTTPRQLAFCAVYP